ncbi:hypothetical protein [Aquabacterium sp.]|uniref:hypothetical protein n=1 Tax=Aquabacterium sp. TaxID=1872578 RepID=UPI0035B04CB3
MRTYPRLLSSLAILIPLTCMSGQEAKVFPVRGFFYDASTDSKLDPLFRQLVQGQSAGALSGQIHDALAQAFGPRVGNLNQSTAGNTFAVSFHVTRANSFVVDKGNGNSDVVATLTGSVYFTNVVSGEILTTLTRTIISRAVAANNSDLNGERSQLFQQALDTLIKDLMSAAPKQFQPVTIETHLTDRSGELLVLDAGYRQGLAAGDSIEDSADNLIQVVYAAENYSVAKPVLASNLNLGAAFHKFSAHPASGQDRPSVAVMVEKLPTGYAKDYIARLFSELLGDVAPLSVVQINTGFTQLLQTVREQDGVELSTSQSAGRRPPSLIVRVRIPDTLYYEAGTNLDFEKLRRYETRAFADVIDNSGRIVFSAVGVDVINDKIIRGIGAGFEERREVSIKNALADLAKKLAHVGELKRVRAEIVGSSGDTYQVNSQGRVYGQHQSGVILRKSKARLGKETKDIFLPTVEASVDIFTGQSPTTLKQGLPVDAGHDKVAAGDLFEVQQLGTPARSAVSVAACGPVETLGNMRTPALMEMTGWLLGQKMPAMLYAPDASQLTEGIIGLQSGFSGRFPWDVPAVTYCIQPVERVNVGAEQCSQQCERPIVSRYTLRVKKAEEVQARITFESQFKSTGYYATTTSPDDTNRLFQADVLDEARGVLEKAVDKLSLPPQ